MRQTKLYETAMLANRGGYQRVANRANAVPCCVQSIGEFPVNSVARLQSVQQMRLFVPDSGYFRLSFRFFLAPDFPDGFRDLFSDLLLDFPDDGLPDVAERFLFLFLGGFPLPTIRKSN